MNGALERRSDKIPTTISPFGPPSSQTSLLPQITVSGQFASLPPLPHPPTTTDPHPSPPLRAAQLHHFIPVLTSRSFISTAMSNFRLPGPGRQPSNQQSFPFKPLSSSPASASTTSLLDGDGRFVRGPQRPSVRSKPSAPSLQPSRAPSAVSCPFFSHLLHNLTMLSLAADFILGRQG